MMFKTAFFRFTTFDSPLKPVKVSSTKDFNLKNAY